MQRPDQSPGVGQPGGRFNRVAALAAPPGRVTIDRAAMHAQEHGDADYECAAAGAHVLADRRIVAALLAEMHPGLHSRSLHQAQARLASPPASQRMVRVVGYVSYRKGQERLARIIPRLIGSLRGGTAGLLIQPDSSPPARSPVLTGAAGRRAAPVPGPGHGRRIRRSRIWRRPARPHPVPACLAAPVPAGCRGR
jgi:hypothetical protein